MNELASSAAGLGGPSFPPSSSSVASDRKPGGNRPTKSPRTSGLGSPTEVRGRDASPGLGPSSSEPGSPRLFIPYVQYRPPAKHRLHAETQAVGELLGATFVDLTGDDTGAFALLTRLWAAGEGFLYLEEDVVPSVEVLNEMWACGEEWCAGWFWHYGGEIRSGENRPQRPERHRVAWTLACHKFGTTLLARTPAAVEEAAGMSAQRRHWNQLDLCLVHPDGVLHGPSYRVRPHLHGPVEQLGRTPAWVSLTGDHEWIETGDYDLVPASDQRNNQGAPFFERITKEND